MLFLAVFFYPSNELDFTVSGIDAISRVPILRFFGHLPNDMFPFFTFWVHTKHLKYPFPHFWELLFSKRNQRLSQSFFQHIFPKNKALLCIGIIMKNAAEVFWLQIKKHLPALVTNNLKVGINFFQL